MRGRQGRRLASPVIELALQVSITVLVLPATAARAADEVRYQVLASQVVGNKPVVLMWDNQTGRSWILRSCPPNAQGVRSCEVQWMAIDPNPSEASPPR